MKTCKYQAKEARINSSAILAISKINLEKEGEMCSLGRLAWR